ncbi:MAG TPA: cytochrome c biogenesis protein CcsA [Gemmataceae bacterium]|nr:cytochrome c biogenesis protein CcsA [Gemmataceae bacterium]
MNKELQQYVAPGVVVGLACVLLIGVMMPPSDPPGKMQLHEAAKLPVVEGGRVMPLDTVARNSLMLISGKQSFVDDKGRSQPAIKWLFDVMTIHDPKDVAVWNPKMPTPQIVNESALSANVFRIENDQVLNLLRLKPTKGFRYSVMDIDARTKEFLDQVDHAIETPGNKRDLVDAKVLELEQHRKIFTNIRLLRTPLVIPPQRAGEDWRSLPDALVADAVNKRHKAPSWEFVALLNAYAKGDAAEFNATLASYQKMIEKQLPVEAEKTDFETFFNNFSPFYYCAILYVFVLILACASWIAFPKDLKRAAFSLAVLTLVVHTFALFARMYLMGRPLVFVTNLYSSAVFIGWICVMLGLVLEWIFHNSLGTFVAGIIGALTLVVGHYLAITSDNPDTMEMMRAVLDTNFWLATHVTSVTIGYSATFVAGILGIVLICLGVFTTKLTKDLYKILGQMIYGIVCFAMLFSFVGTVLGGIWADQSWGRFWGWDAKENGALLIVIWNALILHARWGGMVQQRGMAALAVLGNIVTAWSWFGVNMLGVGLHNYGFVASHLMWLLTWDAFNLIVVGIALVPINKWPSFTARAAAPPSVLPAPPVIAPAPGDAIKAAPSTRKSKHVKATVRS